MKKMTTQYSLDTAEQVKKLCQLNKEVMWASGKNNQNLNFNVGVLQAKWIPLFKLICNILIPTMHSSHITLDRAILLYTMIEMRKVDDGWIIYNNMIDFIKPFERFWFPAVITQLYVNASVGVAKNEEKIKVGLAIFSKTRITNWTLEN